MASLVGKNVPQKPGLPDADLLAEYWQALLDDPRGEMRPVPSGAELPMSRIAQHVLRVGCRRGCRVIEIQKVDATRLYVGNLAPMPGVFPDYKAPIVRKRRTQ